MIRCFPLSYDDVILVVFKGAEASPLYQGWPLYEAPNVLA
jgi:hypothetical protein